MINIEKQVAYWRAGAEEDRSLAEDIIGRRPRYALFFAHLALEKLLKAHVCRTTHGVPPRIHQLVRLAELARLDTPVEYLKVLARMNRFAIEGRYPGTSALALTRGDARSYLDQGREVFQWLMSQL